ncbi:hypothetical protein CLOM_g15221 [Closterium sp. NIES-68]|nr:hypothetical protein CLOM_g15221 [Closterium sp. NIES-68]GJP72302.1 hypothetical protein CLOP_g3049 [Closterium sp. NIES-67]
MAGSGRHVHLLLCLVLIGTIVRADAKYIVVGKGSGSLFGQIFSPWTFGVSSWKAPKVYAGDQLVFRWVLPHNVKKFSDGASYSVCDFTFAKTLQGTSYVGLLSYTVQDGDKGQTLYFGSSESSDCKRNLKVQVPVQLF